MRCPAVVTPAAGPRPAHGFFHQDPSKVVESKTNEITKVEPLLEGLEIQGVVVTGDRC